MRGCITGIHQHLVVDGMFPINSLVLSIEESKKPHGTVNPRMKPGARVKVRQENMGLFRFV